MLFKTKVLQQLNGFTGDMFQSAAAHKAFVASLSKSGFCLMFLRVTCLASTHMASTASFFKTKVLKQLSLHCSLLKPGFCNNVMVLRVTCFNQLQFIWHQLQAFCNNLLSFTGDMFQSASAPYVT
jgi:hypothetical protein